MLETENTLLLVIDVQEKLTNHMYQKESLIDGLRRIILGVKSLHVPIVVTEQLPEKLGATISEIGDLLHDVGKISKSRFSCWGDPVFRDWIRKLGRRQILLSGIETHVCIYQTASDLLDEGFEVHLVEDAVSSRSERNRELGIARALSEGSIITSVEMALFELLKEAGGDKFKEVLKIVR